MIGSELVRIRKLAILGPKRKPLRYFWPLYDKNKLKVRFSYAKKDGEMLLFEDRGTAQKCIDMIEALEPEKAKKCEIIIIQALVCEETAKRYEERGIPLPSNLAR